MTTATALKQSLATATNTSRSHFDLYTNLGMALEVASRRKASIAVLVEDGYIAVTTRANGEKLQALGYELAA